MKSRDLVTAALMTIFPVVGQSGCGGGTAAQVSPPVQPQPPQPSSPVSIMSISPTGAVAGSPDLVLTVSGANLDLVHTGSHGTTTVLVWSEPANLNTPLVTTVLSSTELTAVVPAGLLAKPVKAVVLVQKYYFADDMPFAESNSLNFSVTSALASSTSTSVSPAVVTLGLGGAQQFVASINGARDDATWTIKEGLDGGSITPGGLYTVPSHVGVFHAVATFVLDPSKSAEAEITVVPSGFAEIGKMHVARTGHTATLLSNGKVLIAGGVEAGADGAVAELFDSRTASFSITGSMNTARLGATATVLADGRVLFTGGSDQPAGCIDQGGFLRILNTAEIYDPTTETFRTTGSMVVPRVSHTATLLGDGQVLITGGIDRHGGGGGAVADAELYDPATGTFSSIGGLHTDRAQHTATLLGNGDVLIAGGWNGHRADAADDPPWDPLFAELYKPASHAFVVTSTMSTTRIGHTAVRLADGRILMLGGVPKLQNIDEQPADPEYAEFYDSVANSFSPLAGFRRSRQGYTATLLSIGKVLLVGGQELGTSSRTAELLNVVRDSSVVTGELVAARSNHTATLLLDGRVLVTGGTDSNGNVLATAELYK